MTVNGSIARGGASEADGVSVEVGANTGNEERRLRLVSAGADATAAPALSAREVEVLLAWFRSESKSEAAQELYISVGTLNTHLARVRAKYAKAGRVASTKAALVVRALQDGLVSLDDW
ncbi:LuxR C-terminal-related transcriptional regulator [Tomitella gaofuii]|uniref:LuxR C-terminal-related transcriptional regulator n=1 Tax=Tomitella gaofuii TaxID=2760083 RepID=UPI0027E49ED1|nr:LuxR C-terminal-related transcriptional regulator [Tomitella gaofuii]